MRTRHQILAANGVSLVEVLIAVAILTTIALGVAQLIAMATAAMSHARLHTTAVILAAARMDELRSLAWTFEPTGPGVPALPKIRSRHRLEPARPSGWRTWPAVVARGDTFDEYAAVRRLLDATVDGLATTRRRRRLLCS